MNLAEIELQTQIIALDLCLVSQRLAAFGWPTQARFRLEWELDPKPTLSIRFGELNRGRRTTRRAALTQIQIVALASCAGIRDTSRG